MKHISVLFCTFMLLIQFFYVNEALAEKVSTQNPKRFIWIAIDSLRADHLHYMGYPFETSPWLDELAKKSVNFSLAITPSDGTHCSTPAYMTGKLYSRLHRKPISGKGIPKSQDTIAEVLQRAGYTTTLWTTNGFLCKKKGFDQGVNSLRVLRGITKPNFSLDEIISLLETKYTPSGNKEFIYLHTMDVHYPYEPPYPYDRMFTSSKSYKNATVRDGLILDERNEIIKSNLKFHMNYKETIEGREITDEDMKQIVGLYDGTIRYTDSRLQRLLDVLQFDPRNDVLIITSDHGEQFYERGFWGHSRSTLIEEIRVPLIIHHDGFVPSEHKGPVSILDVFPTICELAGLEVPGDLDGQSLVPILQGGSVSERYVCSEGYHGKGPKVTLVGNEYVYNLHVEARKLYADTAWPFVELLFDHTNNPACDNDISNDKQDIARKMNGILRKENIQFSNYHYDKIQKTDKNFKLSKNLIIPSSIERNITSPPEQITDVQAEDDVHSLTMNNIEMVWSAKAPKLNRYHFVSLDYKLLAGTMDIELRDGNSKEVFWHAECRVSTKEWQTVSASIILRGSEDVELAATMTSQGDARFKNPSLQHIKAPYIPLIYHKIKEEEEIQKEEELTEADKVHLKALGYL